MPIRGRNASGSLLAVLLVLVFAGCARDAASDRNVSAPVIPAQAARQSIVTPDYTPSPTMLGDTTGKYSLIQVLDRRMTTQQITSEAPHEAVVWGSFNPSAWNAGHPGMVVSDYMVPMNDVSAISGHDLAWWQANHNDWVLYACDSNGNPTTDVPGGDGFPDVPLAYWNPSVIQYQLELIVPWIISHGYNALAVDQVTFKNYMWAPNKALGEGSPIAGWFACGTYSGSGATFVKRYTLGPGKKDPAWVADMVNWVKTVRNLLATDPKISSYHVKFLVNHALNGATNSDPNEQAIIANVDGMMNEEGISNYNRYGVNVSQYLSYMLYVQSQHVAFWDINYFCANTPGITCESSLTAQQIDLAMAMHQLGNQGGAGFFVSPSTGDIPSYHAVFQTQLGSPCNRYQSPATNLFFRRFTGGYVTVNNDPKNPQSITLPSTHTYLDVEGRTVTSVLVLQPHDGYVLTTTGNGCQ